MADRIIASGDARPIPPSEESKTRSRLLAEIADELEVAGALADLAQWIETARYYVDTVRSQIEHRPKLQEIFGFDNFPWMSAVWDDPENTGLTYLQHAISAHLRKAREVAAVVPR